MQHLRSALLYQTTLPTCAAAFRHVFCTIASTSSRPSSVPAPARCETMEEVSSHGTSHTSAVELTRPHQPQGDLQTFCPMQPRVLHRCGKLLPRSIPQGACP